jgi:hypothetical protein
LSTWKILTSPALPINLSIFSMAISLTSFLNYCNAIMRGGLLSTNFPQSRQKRSNPQIIPLPTIALHYGGMIFSQERSYPRLPPTIVPGILNRPIIIVAYRTIGLFQAGNSPDNRRFTRTRRDDQDHDLPLLAGAESFDGELIKPLFCFIAERYGVKLLIPSAPRGREQSGA